MNVAVVLLEKLSHMISSVSLVIGNYTYSCFVGRHMMGTGQWLVKIKALLLVSLQSIPRQCMQYFQLKEYI